MKIVDSYREEYAFFKTRNKQVWGKNRTEIRMPKLKYTFSLMWTTVNEKHTLIEWIGLKGLQWTSCNPNNFVVLIASGWAVTYIEVLYRIYWVGVPYDHKNGPISKKIYQILLGQGFKIVKK